MYKNMAYNKREEGTPKIKNYIKERVGFPKVLLLNPLLQVLEVVVPSCQVTISNNNC